jgi:hypothetical protein
MEKTMERITYAQYRWKLANGKVFTFSGEEDDALLIDAAFKDSEKWRYLMKQDACSEVDQYAINAAVAAERERCAEKCFNAGIDYDMDARYAELIRAD